MSEQRMLHFAFLGYCTRCARPVGDAVHQDDQCSMAGVEERMPLLNLAARYWTETLRLEKELHECKVAAEMAEMGL